MTLAGSNAPARGDVPHTAIAPSAESHTATREIHSARQASATAGRQRSGTAGAPGARRRRVPGGAAWVASRGMPAFIVAAQSFSERHGNEVTALLTLLGGFALLLVVHRGLRGRAGKLAGALGPDHISPQADTRLRFLRRAVEATIIIVTLALAVAQVTTLDRLASTVLASSAIAAAIVGFAARQVLANGMAGVVLAITQPVRIGDVVTIEGETGIVEDLTLTYTWLRTGSDARLIIPNERLAAGVLRNDSIRSAVVALEVSLWLAPEDDEAAALAAIRGLEEVRDARIAEITHEGMRILVAGPPVAPVDRLAREGDLRAEALRALRQAGCRAPRGESSSTL